METGIKRTDFDISSCKLSLAAITGLRPTASTVATTPAFGCRAGGCSGCGWGCRSACCLFPSPIRLSILLPMLFSFRADLGFHNLLDDRPLFSPRHSETRDGGRVRTRLTVALSESELVYALRPSSDDNAYFCLLVSALCQSLFPSPVHAYPERALFRIPPLFLLLILAEFDTRCRSSWRWRWRRGRG